LAEARDEPTTASILCHLSRGQGPRPDHATR
jgi:hypothetical protein